MPSVRLVETSFRDGARSPGRWGARLAAAFVLTAGCTVAQSPDEATTWVLLKDDGHTWCGYTHVREARAEAAKLHGVGPRAVFSYELVGPEPQIGVREITVQFEPKGGDWSVVDSYVHGVDYLGIYRTIRIKKYGGVVIEQGTLGRGPLRTYSFKSFDGATPPVDISEVNLPEVPIWPWLSDAPFVIVENEIRGQGRARLCKAF